MYSPFKTNKHANKRKLNKSKQTLVQANKHMLTCCYGCFKVKLPETYGSKPMVTMVLCEHQNRWETDEHPKKMAARIWTHSKALSSVGTVPLPRASSHCSVCRVLLATSSGAAISLGVHQQFDIPKMWISASNPGMSMPSFARETAEPRGRQADIDLHVLNV